MLDQAFTIAGKHVDDRNLNHRIATRLQTHRGTGHIDQHLTGKCWIIDAHVEL